MSARATCGCCGRVRDIMSLDCVAGPKDGVYGVLVCADRYGCYHLQRPINGPFSYKEQRIKAKLGAAALEKGTPSSES